MKRRCILAILAVAVLSLGSCGGVSLTSRQKDRDITIDGKLSDWNGALEFVNKAGLSFAVMNDDAHMYIAVAATDQLVRQQIMVSGLYLWFDEKGEKEKNFGVCFPMGGLENRSVDMRPPSSPGADSLGARGPMPPPDSMSRPDSTGGRPPMSGPGLRGGPGPSSGAGPMAPREMMVYSVKSDTWDQGKGSLGGVDVAADLGRKALVLEFRIPLERDPSTGYGIGGGPGQTIGVGVESPAIKGSAEVESGPPEAENRGPRGGQPGGSSGGGAEQQRRPEAIKIWGKLSLAEKRSS